MLRKLMKHEFRATGRIMLPMFLVLLVTSLAANFSVHRVLDVENDFLNLLGGLLVVAFVVAMAAVALVSFVLMVRRFYKNLLQDEGYVMLTLPVSVHRQVWSKLIVSTVWFFATLAVIVLALVIMTLDVRFVEQIWEAAGAILREVIARNHVASFANGVLGLLELALLVAVGYVALCVKCYAAMSVGFSFSSRKLLWSVVVYIGMEMCMSLLEGVGVFLLNDSPLHYFLLGWTGEISAAAAMHLSLWLMILLETVYAAVFYFLTTYFLKNRLNLE